MQVLKTRRANRIYRRLKPVAWAFCQLHSSRDRFHTGGHKKWATQLQTLPLSQPNANPKLLLKDKHTQAVLT